MWWDLDGLDGKPCAVGVLNPFDVKKEKICWRHLDFCSHHKPAIFVLMCTDVQGSLTSDRI